MRAARLARIAAQAEALRLRQFANRTATRVILAAVAVFFLIAAIVSAHIAGAIELTRLYGPLHATLIVGGVDLFIAVILGAIAASSKPSRIEREALQVRQTAQAQIGEAMAMTALVGPTLRLVGGRKLYGIILAALTARYLGSWR